jgi:hypothetical protein
MVTVMYTFLFLGCSVALSVVAFLVGRCGRKLPIDGALPRVVHSVRFRPDNEHSCATQANRWAGR